ncbi:plasmid pRiA4b ORF-3 family protein [Dyadobacter luteus]|uniref:Plasmid pRiA4b ORF-3 family protein n=1 Tax=Dyadobacter luteus TaxID=2259619 RepID=A0A3D8Y6M7_9BACT|nr:plasmid pRiA4b ORF-3 family protein [Dyadobacter luteus]REA58465.1 plasmid pRiA4b ORF-3 family protein [Dyadobacter luteus]
MTFQFKIQIKNITKPPVWRRLLIADSATFERFHEVIQAAFGWEDYHMFQFSRTGYGSDEIIGIVDEEEDDDFFMAYTKLDASKVKLSEIFQFVGQKYIYIYDFGDDWTHQITLEAILDDTILNPELLAGKGACPPEDCGGVWGYANLKDILSDNKHPEYKEMKKWLGLKPKQEWDPNFFDLEKQQIAVRQS